MNRPQRYICRWMDGWMVIIGRAPLEQLKGVYKVVWYNVSRLVVATRGGVKKLFSFYFLSKK